ncbi:polysaccharide pyruvyl transferase family protein, partial [Paraglaciecola hydrolytica]
EVGCEVKQVKFGLRNLINFDFKAIKYLKQCDYVFDIGEGDSFTDIYKLPRLINQSITKILAKLFCGKLILAPQTYGPFNSNIAKLIVRFTLLFADRVYSRDILSKSVVSKLTSKQVEDFTDLAFSLQFTPTTEKSDESIDTLKVGINVSGLLYNQSLASNNFALKMKYHTYTENLIEYFLAKNIEVCLVPHVISKIVMEDDVSICQRLQVKYPQTTVAPVFDNPSKIKGYISRFDFFVGARMHATIAAFSAGVPVVPCAYSMKFKGVFENLGYNAVVDAKELSTEDAFNKTIEMFDNREQLTEAIQEGNLVAKTKLGNYKSRLVELFNEKSNR